MGKATCTYGLSYEVAKVSVAFTEETDSYSLLAAPVLSFSSLRIEAMHLSFCVFLDLAWPIKDVILSVRIFGKFSGPIHVISLQPPVIGDSLPCVVQHPNT